MRDTKIFLYNAVAGITPDSDGKHFLSGTVEEVKNFLEPALVLVANYEHFRLVGFDVSVRVNLAYENAIKLAYAIIENPTNTLFCFVTQNNYVNMTTVNISLRIDAVNTYMRDVVAHDVSQLISVKQSHKIEGINESVADGVDSASMVLYKTLSPTYDTDVMYALIVAKDKITIDQVGWDGNDLTKCKGLLSGVTVYVLPFARSASNKNVYIGAEWDQKDEEGNIVPWEAKDPREILDDLLTEPNVVDIYITDHVTNTWTWELAKNQPSNGFRAYILKGNSLNSVVPLPTSFSNTFYANVFGVREMSYLNDKVFDVSVYDIVGDTSQSNEYLLNPAYINITLNDKHAIDFRYLALGNIEITRKYAFDGASLKEIYMIAGYKNGDLSVSDIGAQDTKNAFINDDKAHLVLKNDAWKSYAVNNKVNLRTGLLVNTASSVAGNLIAGNYASAAIGGITSIAKEFINRANIKATPDDIRDNGSAVFDFILTGSMPKLKVYRYSSEVLTSIKNTYLKDGYRHLNPVTTSLEEVINNKNKYHFYAEFDGLETSAVPKLYGDELRRLCSEGIHFWKTPALITDNKKLYNYSDTSNFEV